MGYPGKASGARGMACSILRMGRDRIDPALCGIHRYEYADERHNQDHFNYISCQRRLLSGREPWQTHFMGSLPFDVDSGLGRNSMTPLSPKVFAFLPIFISIFRIR